MHNDYSQYLYFKPITLTESNLYILNEMYFGKTPRIKLLEKLIQLWLDSFDVKNKITEKDLEKFKFLDKDQLKREKYLKYLKKDDEKVYETSKTEKIILSKIQEQIVSYIKKSLEIIFGIHEINIKFMDNGYAIHNDFKYDNKKIKLSDIEKNFSLSNDYNIEIISNHIKDSIIVKNTGISFNPVKCPLSCILYIPELKYYLPENNLRTAEEIVSSLLHEIGHFFSYFIIPYENFNKKEKYLQRIDEKFADMFVAMYGYGTSTISKFTKSRINEFLYDYLQTKNDLNKNIDLYKNYDEHPNTYSRMRSQLLYLKDARKSKNLSDVKRRQLNADIKRVTDNLKSFKTKPLDFEINQLKLSYYTYIRLVIYNINPNYDQYTVEDYPNLFNIKNSNEFLKEINSFRYSMNDDKKLEISEIYDILQKENLLPTEENKQKLYSLSFEEAQLYKEWLNKQHLYDLQHSRTADTEKIGENEGRLRPIYLVRELDRLYDNTKKTQNYKITDSDIVKYRIISLMNITNVNLNPVILNYFNKFFIDTIKENNKIYDNTDFINLENYLKEKYKNNFDMYINMLPKEKSCLVKSMYNELARFAYFTKFQKLFSKILEVSLSKDNKDLTKHYNLLKEYIEGNHWNEVKGQIQTIFKQIDLNVNYNILNGIPIYNIPFVISMQTNKIPKESLYYFNKFLNYLIKEDYYIHNSFNLPDNYDIYTFSKYILIKYQTQINKLKMEDLYNNNFRFFSDIYSEIITLFEKHMGKGKRLTRFIRLYERKKDFEDPQLSEYYNSILNILNTYYWDEIEQIINDWME